MLSRLLRVKPNLNRLASSIQRSALRPTSVSFQAYKHASAVNNPQSGISSQDSFMDGATASYVEEMFHAWQKDPDSVHLSWRVYFSNMSNGAAPSSSFSVPPTLIPNADTDSSFSTSFSSAPSEVVDHLKVQLLVRAYQVQGHRIANLDPLGILDADLDPTTPKELELEHYGFTEADLDREFNLGPGMLPSFPSNGINTLTLREIINHLKSIYSK